MLRSSFLVNLEVCRLIANLQLYYRMNSFTGIFQQRFKLPPCFDVGPHPHQILTCPFPPKVGPGGKGGHSLTSCLQHLWETLWRGLFFCYGYIYSKDLASNLQCHIELCFGTVYTVWVPDYFFKTISFYLYFM